jgi:hypothetical protein
VGRAVVRPFDKTLTDGWSVTALEAWAVRFGRIDAFFPPSLLFNKLPFVLSTFRRILLPSFTVISLHSPTPPSNSTVQLHKSRWHPVLYVLPVVLLSPSGPPCLPVVPPASPRPPLLPIVTPTAPRLPLLPSCRPLLPSCHPLLPAFLPASKQPPLPPVFPQVLPAPPLSRISPECRRQIWPNISTPQDSCGDTPLRCRATSRGPA